MLFTSPESDERELEVLAEVEELKQRLRYQLREPRRWYGSLRRLSEARQIRGSNTIEGYDASLDDAAAIAAGEEPLDADQETRRALSGYHEAMTYVLQLAADEDFAAASSTPSSSASRNTWGETPSGTTTSWLRSAAARGSPATMPGRGCGSSSPRISAKPGQPSPASGNRSACGWTLRNWHGVTAFLTGCCHFCSTRLRDSGSATPPIARRS